MSDSGSTITIGGASKPLRDADSAWITSQINGRGNNVCVVIKIVTGDVDLTLATSACSLGGGRGGQRQFRPREQEIVDDWRKKNLGDGEFKLGHMVSFVTDLKRHL